MKPLKTILILLGAMITFGCSKETDPTPQEITPGTATLIFPENNTECNEGTVVSDTQTEVTFQWNAAENADSYVVEITNLNTQGKLSVNATTTEAPVTLMRSTPYAWSVTSRSQGSSATSRSSIWNFYNAGPPVANHVPSQATVVNPELDSRVTEGTVNLQWTASDLDNDIASYEILMENSNPPTSVAGTATSNTYQATVVKDLTYYWQVVTIDQTGNRSTSEVFYFHVDEAEPIVVGDNLVADAVMDDTGGWNYRQLWTAADNAVEHGFENGEFAFKSAPGVQFSNAILWQEISVEAGKTYYFNMDVRSEGTTSTWLEIYFGNISPDSVGDDYTEGGAEIYIKSFGQNEDCGIDPYDDTIFNVAASGCPLPEDSLLDDTGRVTFSASNLTADGTFYLGIKAGNYDGNFGTGIYIDDVELREVE